MEGGTKLGINLLLFIVHPKKCHGNKTQNPTVQA